MFHCTTMKKFGKQLLKNNKEVGTDGLLEELMKYFGEEFIRCVHELLYEICSVDIRFDDWNLNGPDSPIV